MGYHYDDALLPEVDDLEASEGEPSEATHITIKLEPTALRIEESATDRPSDEESA